MDFSIVKLFLIFIIYSFAGYIMEVLYVSISNRKLVNRGFLIGPICPIYGVGAVLIILLLKNYFSDPLVVFIFSIILTSFIEYITSWILEKIFMNRWWDYSTYSFNINGRICLKNSLLFGIVSLIMVYIINPSIFRFLNNFNSTILNILAIIILVLFISDIIYSIIQSINLRKRIVIAKEAKKLKLKNIPGYLEKVIKSQVNNFKQYPTHFLKGFPELKRINYEAFDIMRKIKIKEKMNKKEIRNKTRQKIKK